MTSVTADEVVVKIRADLADANAKIIQHADIVDKSMIRVENASGKAEEALVRGSRNSSAAQIILQSAVRKSTDQFAAGAPISVIFAEHLETLAEAAQLSGGKLAGLGAFLASGWGIALTSAFAIASPFIAKLFEGGEASDEMKKKGIELVDALSKEKYGTDEARKALTDYNDEKERARKNDSLATEQSLNEAKARLNDALAIREQIKATVDKALVDEAQSRGVGGGQLLQVVQQGQDQLANNPDIGNSAVEKLRQTIRNIEADIAKDAAKAVNPIEAINQKYKALADAALDAAAGNDKLSASLKAQLVQIEKNHQAEVKAEQDREAAARAAAKAGPQTPFLSPVTGGRVTGAFGESRPGHTHAGVDFAVPVGTPVRAPAGGVVDVAGQREGYGNAIYINFGAGTTGRFGHLSKFNVKPGDVVNAGDIIGYTGGAKGADGSGDSTGPHLHYEVRRNGRAVNPLTGKYPTDAGGASDDEARQAKEAAKQRQAAADKAVKEQETFNRDLAGLDELQLAAKKAQAESADEIAAIATQQAVNAAAERQKQYDADKKLGRLSDQHYAILVAANAVTLADQKNRIDEDQRRQNAADAEKLSIGQLDTQRDLLQTQLDLATTIKERRAIELKLLDNAYAREKQQLEEQRDTAKTKTDHDLAQAKLDALPAQKAADTAVTNRRNLSPFDSYIQSLPHTADQINEALENAAVNGAANLTDELSKSLANMIGLHGAAGDFLSTLIKIVLQAAEFKALGGGQSGGGGGLAGLFSSIAGTIAGAFAGGGAGAGNTWDASTGTISIGSAFGRASGGYVGPGQMVNVNEGSGRPELLRMGSQGGTIIPLGQVAAQRARSAPSVIELHVGAGEYFDAHVARVSGPIAQSVSVKVVQTAAPAIADAGARQAQALAAKQRRYG